MEHEITVREFQELLDGQSEMSPEHPAKFCLLDVREPWEAETASLPNSLIIPMSELPTRAQRELDPEAHIVAYCHNGRRSLQAAIWLREQGFARSQSLAGGIEAWSLMIDPSVPRY